MFELSVGQDVKLAFNSSDLSAAGLPVADLFRGLLAGRGTEVARLLAAPGGAEEGVVGELGDSAAKPDLGTSVVLASGGEVRSFREEGRGGWWSCQCSGGFGGSVGPVDVGVGPVGADVGGGGRGQRSAGVVGQSVLRGVRVAETGGDAVSEDLGESAVPVREDGPDAGGAVSVGGSTPARGARYERNLKLKAKRKARKLRKQGAVAGVVGVEESGVSTGAVGSSEPIRAASAVPKWRVGAAPLAGAEQAARAEPKRGFFSECDSETRRRLRESRAQLLIAENERKRAVEEKKLAGMNSPEGFLRELKRVLAMVGSFKKADSTPVGKWARTVAEGYAETIARSVPSSCPSLESLPFGATSETTVVDSEKLAAEQAYVRERAELDAAYENAEFYLPDQYDREIEALRERHPLVFPPSEEDLEHRKLMTVMTKLGKFNLNDLTNEEIAKYLD